MALSEQRIFPDSTIGEYDKVQIAIDRLKTFEPPEGYYLAFSGGKDSCCIKALADMAGVKYDAHYNLTTVDPPELVQFIKHQHPDVIIDKPELSMWELIVKKKLPPTRTLRYCCDVLKEGSGNGRFIVTGVRWAESARRKNNSSGLVINYGRKIEQKIKLLDDNSDARNMVEQCQMKSKHILNPIIDWDDSDVWEFINNYQIPYCSLYDEGFKRLGCIGCPMQGGKGMIRNFERWPTYKKMYIRAFQKMVDKRIADGLETDWKTGEDVFDRWIMG